MHMANLAVLRYTFNSSMHAIFKRRHHSIFSFAQRQSLFLVWCLLTVLFWLTSSAGCRSGLSGGCLSGAVEFVSHLRGLQVCSSYLGSLPVPPNGLDRTHARAFGAHMWMVPVRLPSRITRSGQCRHAKGLFPGTAHMLCHAGSQPSFESVYCIHFCP